MLLFFCCTAWRRLCHGKGALPQKAERHFNKTRYLVEKANANASHLDPYAMKWLFTDDDFSDTDMDKFLEGLPGYVNSHFTVTAELPEVLTAPYILERIKEHLLTCVTTTGLSEQARIKRVSTCVESLRVILHLRTSAKNPDNESLRTCLQSIVDGLNSLCDNLGIKNLHAFCVRALAFQGFLTRGLEPAWVVSPANIDEANINEANIKALTLRYFHPLYTHFRSITNEKDSPDEDEQWRVLLHDGPFINLTLFAEAILLHDHLDVDPTTLSMCWKTLDILRSGLQIPRVNISPSSLQLFTEIHTETRSRVESEELGFSVIPLLEILDAVDGGRRLSMVFQHHPKYRNLVFGKDHLRNPDLFRAFAICLPHFVAEHSAEESKDLMEGLVLHDHLWISLQVHLLNSLRPNSFIPAMIRVFDTCCTVIDIAFVALEGSQKVDFRTPDFGSLAHYFDVYVTGCFQGMFIERAIGFRVGLIKARFCNAVLAQFLDEFSRKSTIVFRSHWDVASLARVFYSLGLGDVEFWSSFVDGGPIGEVLMAKTYATLKLAKRDGPLLNFCRLVHLGVMVVPFEGSGLKETDFKKLLDLMQKMTDDSPLPLAHASTSVTVWEELRQLQDDVAGIYERSRGEDRPHMEALLLKINEVYRRRPLPSHGHLPIGSVQAQASETPAIVQSDPPSGGLLIHENNRSSRASTSATLIEDQHNNSPIEEVDSGGTVFRL